MRATASRPASHVDRSVDTMIVLALAAVALGLMAGTLPLQTIGLLVIAVTCFLAGLVRPSIGVAIIVVSVPIQTDLMVGVGSTLITLTKLAIWSTFAGWSVAVLMGRRRPKFDAVLAGLLLVLGALFLSLWNATDGGFWLGEVYRWVAVALVYGIARSSFDRSSDYRYVIFAFGLGTIYAVSLALWQVITNVGPASFEVRGFIRGYGPFSHPNQFAILIETAVPLLLSVLIGAWWTSLPSRGRPLRQSWIVWLTGVSLLAGLAGSVASQSRGGLLGLLGGLLTVLFLSALKAPIVTPALAAIGYALLAAGVSILIWSFAGQPSVLVRHPSQVTSGNFAIQERLAHWAAAVNMASWHPFLGVGAGNFDLLYRDATPVWRFRIGRGHAHSTYLQMLAQAGVLGLTSYLLLLGIVIVSFSQAIYRRAGGVRLALVIAALGSTVAVMVHGLFEYVHVLSLPVLLAILWAMAACVIEEAGVEPNAQQNMEGMSA